MHERFKNYQKSQLNSSMDCIMCQLLLAKNQGFYFDLRLEVTYNDASSL